MITKESYLTLGKIPIKLFGEEFLVDDVFINLDNPYIIVTTNTNISNPGISFNVSNIEVGKYYQYQVVGTCSNNNVFI